MGELERKYEEEGRRSAGQPPMPVSKQPPKPQTLDSTSTDTRKSDSAYPQHENHKSTGNCKGQRKAGAKNKGKGGLGKADNGGSSAGKGKGKGGSVAGKGKGKGKSCEPRQPRVPEPPVDSAGEWVLRERFRGKKSFGFYACPCGRSWLTAHAQKEYRQGCQGCDTECFPHYMWLNDHPVERRERADRDEVDGPHDSARCEACRLGVCGAVRTGAGSIR